jgi:hypothetical protein
VARFRVRRELPTTYSPPDDSRFRCRARHASHTGLLAGSGIGNGPRLVSFFSCLPGVEKSMSGSKYRSRQLYTSACSAVEQIRKSLYFISGITSLSVPFYKRDSVYLRFFLTISPFFTYHYPVSSIPPSHSAPSRTSNPRVESRFLCTLQM